MKGNFRLFLALAVLFIFLPSASGQFTSQEVAEKEETEEFLRTAEIVRFEDIGEGVTKPYRLYLRKGGQEIEACWKNPEGIQRGFLEGWQYEIAAYELDKLLDLNMVPPTVEREFRKKQGSLQLWVDSKFSLLTIMEQGIEFPPEAAVQVSNMKYLTRAWDCLIANEDRTQQNILYTEDWRTILIDHSRAFRSSKEFVERLMFGRDGIHKLADGSPLLFRRLPRAFIERVKALDFESVKKAVGPYLKDKEIEAILKRKVLLLAEVDQMIKESGEDRVLY